jgi:hypothetical protein
MVVTFGQGFGEYRGFFDVTCEYGKNALIQGSSGLA